MLVANNPPQLIRAHSAKMDRVPMRPVAMRRASSSSEKPMMVRTGPKISSRAMRISLVACENTVGRT